MAPTKLTKRLEGGKTSIGRKDKTHKEVRAGKRRALGEKTKLTKRLEGGKTSIGRKDKTHKEVRAGKDEHWEKRQNSQRG